MKSRMKSALIGNVLTMENPLSGQMKPLVLAQSLDILTFSFNVGRGGYVQDKSILGKFSTMYTTPQGTSVGMYNVNEG